MSGWTDTITIDMNAISRILLIIKNRGNSKFLTSDVIEEYMGAYSISRIELAPVYAVNPQVGKLLNEHAKALKINKVEDEVSIVDINGRKTTSAQWEFT